MFHVHKESICGPSITQEITSETDWDVYVNLLYVSLVTGNNRTWKRV